jgi:hypothetical protein
LRSSVKNTSNIASSFLALIGGCYDPGLTDTVTFSFSRILVNSIARVKLSKKRNCLTMEVKSYYNSARLYGSTSHD